MVVTGFLIGVLWFVAVAAGALGFVGLDTLLAQPPAILLAGGLAALIPGMIIIMAGFMARTNRRASASNALVMEAAIRLLSPAREAGTEGITIAEQMKQSASEVDRAMAHAISAMKAMSGEIGDERMRLESVAYASADNARDLAQRLASERTALEGLARDLRAQIESMNEAIPRQAQQMVNAARMAGDEVARADEALEARLHGMTVAGESLAAKLIDLDGLARDASVRTETLTFAVSRVEEKLEQSRKLVDAAVRAGEIAAAAASTTGDALKDAVSSALDGARFANREINQSTRAAAEEAASALARLREAGEQAAVAVRAAGNAARAETDMMNRRLGATSAAPSLPATPAKAPETVRERSELPPAATASRPVEPPAAPAEPPRMNGHANGNGAVNGYANGHAHSAADPSATPPVTPPSRPAPTRPAPRPSMEDELFDAAADLLASASLGADVEKEKDRDIKAPEAPAHDAGPAESSPPMLRRRFDDNEPAMPATPARRATDVPGAQASSGALVPSPGRSLQSSSDMGWRDIISDMSRDEPAATPTDREEIADEMIQRLQTSGILLPEAFRPKAKRKIAEAARHGDRERRAAIMDNAGRQVERVTQRLRSDRDLLQLAREFISLEEEDALNALEQTQKTSRNASPRLAAYLLLDAAAGASAS
ncbi:hypothetical protein HY30_01510 [Hyphomonas chukchiensis]|uniref:TipN n=2 Tax=Hyphomonas chukchiensis TaxID=1280947 RepID=A0A062UP11_9PROT|nr:hypothetical protein HY30_01510 [Hyphomonas chukchiensis]